MDPNPMQSSDLPFSIQAQPTETSCGPTCLHAVYAHFGIEYSLERLIREVPEHADGGTSSVMLAQHAVSQGLQASIYSYNVKVFDPTWENATSQQIAIKLTQRSERTHSVKARANLQAYVNFINSGGTIRFDELTSELLCRILDRGTPMIAGLSSTYLYRNCRIDKDGKDSDIYGEPEGHFVVIADWHPEEQEFVVADPYQKNPMAQGRTYKVGSHRLINSILLGIVTYDANLLVIQPRYLN